jgi:Arc/MetJ-type ribon-helix-helix transcriptional regulator
MTIELTPEHQSMIERVMHSGGYHDAQDVISAALEALAEDVDDAAVTKARKNEPRVSPTAGQERAEAIERLVTFGQRHGLSLGGITIRELRDEARP